MNLQWILDEYTIRFRWKSDESFIGWMVGWLVILYFAVNFSSVFCRIFVTHQGSPPHRNTVNKSISREFLFILLFVLFLFARFLRFISTISFNYFNLFNFIFFFQLSGMALNMQQRGIQDCSPDFMSDHIHP